MEDGFVEYIIDQLSPFGAITSRRMFGGYGIYCSGLIVAIIADSELYMKADADCAPNYQRLGCEKFTYYKNDKPYSMNYWKLPAEVFEDPEQMKFYLGLSFSAASRAAINKKFKKKGRRK